MNMNQRPMSIACWPSLEKIVGSSSSLIAIATAVSGTSISVQVVSSARAVLGPAGDVVAQALRHAHREQEARQLG